MIIHSQIDIYIPSIILLENFLIDAPPAKRIEGVSSNTNGSLN